MIGSVVGSVNKEASITTSAKNPVGTGAVAKHWIVPNYPARWAIRSFQPSAKPLRQRQNSKGKHPPIFFLSGKSWWKEASFHHVSKNCIVRLWVGAWLHHYWCASTQCAWFPIGQISELSSFGEYELLVNKRGDEWKIMVSSSSWWCTHLLD